MKKLLLFIPFLMSCADGYKTYDYNTVVTKIEQDKIHPGFDIINKQPSLVDDNALYVAHGLYQIGDTIKFTK